MAMAVLKAAVLEAAELVVALGAVGRPVFRAAAVAGVEVAVVTGGFLTVDAVLVVEMAVRTGALATLGLGVDRGTGVGAPGGLPLPFSLASGGGWLWFSLAFTEAVAGGLALVVLSKGALDLVTGGGLG